MYSISICITDLQCHVTLSIMLYKNMKDWEHMPYRWFPFIRLAHKMPYANSHQQ